MYFVRLILPGSLELKRQTQMGKVRFKKPVSTSFDFFIVTYMYKMKTDGARFSSLAVSVSKFFLPKLRSFLVAEMKVKRHQIAKTSEKQLEKVDEIEYMEIGR